MEKEIIYSIIIERPDDSVEVVASTDDLDTAKCILRKEVIHFYDSLVDSFADDGPYEDGDDYYECGISLNEMEFIDNYFSEETKFSVKPSEME